MSLTPLQRYQNDLKREDFQQDQAQLEAIKCLDELYHRVLEAGPPKRNQGWRRIFGSKKLTPVKGLYFWGGVGRGKTYLMDTFYDALPFKEKMRTHFHRFMRRVHYELKSLKEEADPLDIVAERLAGEMRVLCFDEYFVSDIADAMILANL